MKHHDCLFLVSVIITSSYGQVKPAHPDHYLFPEFTQGVVLLSSGKKDPKLLNYHTLTEQLLFDNQGKILAVPKEQLERVDTVYINSRRFVILNNKFVELLHHSDWDLYVAYKCELKDKGKDAGMGGTSETSAISSPSGVFLEGNVYSLQLPDGVETKRHVQYWLKRNEKLRVIINIRQLKKLYKDKNDNFDDFVETHEVKFENPEAVLRLIEHLESS